MRKFLIALWFVVSSGNLTAQYNPLRLQSEVDQIALRGYSFDNSKEIVLFTGSSSIRKWDSIAQYFPGYTVINTGFGGSQMSDLLFYSDRLIEVFHPGTVFIYEGDNDIAVDKTVEEIMATADSLTMKLKRKLPGVKLIFISAKPSLARWTLKPGYLEFNHALKTYCAATPNVYFADVWEVMLNEYGQPEATLFVADGLHLTEAGYDIWAKELIKYLMVNEE